MTIGTTASYVIYQGNGLTRQWDIPFPFLNKEDILVFLIDKHGEKTPLSGDFEIDQENKIFSYPQEDSDALPLSDEIYLLLQRKTALCQETEFLAQQSFDPQLLEQGYDKAMMIAQELAEELSRTVKFPLEKDSAETNAAAYLQRLQQAKQDAEKANQTAQESMSVASEAAQTAVKAGAAASQAVENLQHYAEVSSSARDEAVQARQEVFAMQESIGEVETAVEKSLAQSLLSAQEAQTAAANAEQSAQNLAAAQESAAQSASAAQSSAFLAQASQQAAAESAQTLQNMQDTLANKADCNLENVSGNVDFVTEQFCDGNGNWYRLYKSGWIEQGGVTSSTTTSLLKPMQDTSYTVFAVQRSTTPPTSSEGSPRGGAISATQIYVVGGAGGAAAAGGTNWIVFGQGAIQ